MYKAAAIATLFTAPLALLELWHTPSSGNLPWLLFLMLWTMAALTAVALADSARIVRDAMGRRPVNRHPVWPHALGRAPFGLDPEVRQQMASLMWRLMLAAVLSGLWLAAVRDQWACFWGVPYCD